MLLGEIQNPMEFKNELLVIKKVVQEKFEKQKYLNEVVKLIEKAKQQEDYIFQQKNRANEEKKFKKTIRNKYWSNCT